MSQQTTLERSSALAPLRQRQLRRAVRWASLLAVVASFFMGSARLEAQSWVPPIGIPRPEFGVSENAPAATQTIVDSLPGSLALNPGDVVEIAPGSYSSALTISGRCTAAKPCFVRGASATRRPLITGLIKVTNASYVVLENLQLEGTVCTAVAIVGASDHISFRRSLLQNLPHPGGSGCTAVHILPDRGQRISDIVVLGNKFHNLGMNKETWNKVDQDFHGVTPSLWGRDATSELQRVWVVDNECSDTSGNCVQVNAGNWQGSHQYLHHVYIGRNVAHDNRQAAFGSKQARDVIISQNTIYRARPYAAAAGDGIAFQYGPDNLWVIFNRIYDTSFGIRQSDTGAGVEAHRAYILGNVISDSYQDPKAAPHWGSPPGWGISLWQGNMSRFVIDNTIYNVHGGIEAIMSGPIEMSGNIVADILPPTGTFSRGSHVAVEHPARNGVARIENMLVYQPDSPVRLHWGGFAGPMSGLARFQTVTGECRTCLEANPLFENAGNGAPRLSVASPARNRNIKHPAYETFKRLYGIDISRGIDGAVRPSGSAWDLGALAYGASNLTAPSAPNNLRTIR